MEEFVPGGCPNLIRIIQSILIELQTPAFLSPPPGRDEAGDNVCRKFTDGHAYRPLFEIS